VVAVAAAAAVAAAPEAATQTATAATPWTSSNMGSDLPPDNADNFGSTPQCLCKQHSHASQQSLH